MPTQKRIQHIKEGKHIRVGSTDEDMQDFMTYGYARWTETEISSQETYTIKGVEYLRVDGEVRTAPPKRPL